MNNEDVNEHYWDGTMMRLVNEDGSWNDLRINKDNIGKAFLLKHKYVEKGKMSSGFECIAILLAFIDEYAVFSTFGTAYTETFNTQLFQVDNVYKDPGDVWFGEILTDHAIYIPSDFGIYMKTNDDGKDTIMVDHALVTYIESEDDKDG
jgi:hypothetical protein